MPFETLSAASDALKQWDGSFQSGATNTLQPERQRGEWTDDTKMALALAESLFENETYNPLDALSRYLAWYVSGDHRGIGKTVREALDRALRGHHWNSTGVLHSKGGGTAMRVAPIGSYYRKNPLVAAHMARIDARLTHISLEAEEGSAAIAVGVALLAENLTAKEDLLTGILNFLEASEIAQSLGFLKTLGNPVKSDQNLQTVLTKVGSGSLVTQVVPSALACFLFTESFQDAVEYAVRAGGDTDTRAAITGALAGSFYGEPSIQPYLSDLEGSARLKHLDHLLYLTAPDIPDDL